MNDMLTYAEIKKRYDGEWVLIVDLITTKKLEIVKGKVASHSKNRDVVYRKAMKLRPKHAAVLYIGKVPKGRVFVLSALQSAA